MITYFLYCVNEEQNLLSDNKKKDYLDGNPFLHCRPFSAENKKQKNKPFLRRAYYK